MQPPSTPLLLDGGLASSLEALGCELNDHLWSARLLVDDPELITQVHRSFLQAGADIITSASYQASFAGFARQGTGESEAIALLRRSIELALDARDGYWQSPLAKSQKQRPLVAASVGPYGAALADGSEYRGDYAENRETLRDFHARRWQVLAESGADIMACETIPSATEADVLLDLLNQTPQANAWLAFSCKDEAHISDGTPIEQAIAPAARCEQVLAVGVNCTAPDDIPGLIARLRACCDKTLIIYPNFGGHYDADSKTWEQRAQPIDWGEAVLGWVQSGARIVGGCCGIGPTDIAVMRSALDAMHLNLD